MTLNLILFKFKIEFKRYFLYYQEFILLFIMSATFTLIRYSLVSNVFIGSSNENLYVLKYFFISLLITQVTFSELNKIIQSDFRKGTTVHIGTKPINKVAFYLVGSFADFIGNLIMKGIPLFLFSHFVLKLRFSALQFSFLLIELFVIFIINSMIHYILGLITLDRFRGVIIENMYTIIYSLASGMLIPIYFYPDKVISIIEWLPFKFLLYRPLMVLISDFTFSSVMEVISMQIVWIPILMIIIRVVERVVGERIYING